MGVSDTPRGASVASLRRWLKVRDEEMIPTKPFKLNQRIIDQWDQWKIDMNRHSVASAGFVEHGGHIIYKANVKEVLMEPTGNDDGLQRAVGVRLSDGRQFRSKTVISNASRWDTFEGMIGENFDLIASV